MAEKRIVLTVDDGYCETECVYFPIACSDECEHIDKPTFSYTRQEAIERMAKAMCRRDYRISCDKCIYKNSNNCKTTLENWFIEDAEAALNALLEVNNER